MPMKNFEQGNFEQELQSVLNKFSKDAYSNTPDFILADYMRGCLEQYNKALRARDAWFNLDPWDVLKKNVSEHWVLD